MRRMRNNIVAIRDDNKWLLDKNEISDYFYKNFKELYKSDNLVIPFVVERLGCKYTTDHENQDIISISSEKEIQNCVEKLHPLKSLGPDGFSGFFFRSYWRTFGKRVVRFIQEFFKLRKVPCSINKTFMVLIQKLDIQATLTIFVL